MRTDRFVAKFGGSSLATAREFERVREIIGADARRRVIIVSAPGKAHQGDTKITDLLLQCHDLHSSCQTFEAPWAVIEERFLDIVRSLEVELDIQTILDQAKVGIVGGGSRDFAASRGEAICALIMARYLQFTHIEAAEVMFFHDSGSFDARRSYQALRAAMSDEDKGVVIGGFYGSGSNGIRVFDRDGSDITGSHVTAALGAGVYENWKDVDGVQSADPRIVVGTRTVPHMSFVELREMAYRGGQVLHPSTLDPLMSCFASVRVRNTNAPELPGTTITRTREIGEWGVVGVSGKRGFRIFKVRKAGINDEVGFGVKYLRCFTSWGIPYDHLATSMDEISVIVNNKHLDSRGVTISRLRQTIERETGVLVTSDLYVEHNVALVSVVGQGMSSIHTPGRIMDALRRAHIHVLTVIWTGGPGYTVAVMGEQFEQAVRALHTEFFYRPT